MAADPDRPSKDPGNQRSRWSRRISTACSDAALASLATIWERTRFTGAPPASNNVGAAADATNVKRNIRRAPHEADAAQAAVFIALLSAHIDELAIAVEVAELAAAGARRRYSQGAERRSHVLAGDLRAELRELQRQIDAIRHRFPLLRGGEDSPMLVAAQ